MFIRLMKKTCLLHPYYFHYRLEQRTRSSLLANLYQDLTAMTTQYLGIPEFPTDVSGSGAETHRNKTQSSSTIIESVKRALSSKSKLESATNGNSAGGGLTSNREHVRLSKSKSTLGEYHI